MIHTFPYQRLHGSLSQGLVEFPNEAKLFIPFSDFFAARGYEDRYHFLAIYPSDNWSCMIRVFGFIPGADPVSAGIAYLPLEVTEKTIAFRPTPTLLDHLHPESNSVVVIGQGYSFELWDEKAFSRYTREKLEEWHKEGSIDTRLIMQKWHPWSRLRARVVVQPNEGQSYRTIAELKGGGVELYRFDYSTWGHYKTIRDLGRRVISLFDAYIEGATNLPEILAVHEACKVR